MTSCRDDCNVARTWIFLKKFPFWIIYKACFAVARLLVSSRVELHVPPSMSLSNTEQAIHDRINLIRLVKRIEKSAAENDWSHVGGIDLWARAQGTLQVSTSPVCLYLFKRRFCCGWSENTTCKEIVEECRSRWYGYILVCAGIVLLRSWDEHVRSFRKSSQRYRDMRITLDRTEKFVSNIEKVILSLLSSDMLTKVMAAIST